MELLDEKYWSNRWLKNETGWDIGYPSTPIKEYIDQLKNNALSVLIPGCGNAYEAEYLYKKGFKNTFVLDISIEALQRFKQRFKQRFPDYPEQNLFHEDFFEHTKKYDLIIEQTFFCAINPSLRSKYAEKAYELLNRGGKLAGLLFNENLVPGNPPFGGNKNEYLQYFEPYFNILVFDECYNSIKPREKRELFVILSKK